MLEGLLDLGMAVLSGGVTGLLGTAISGAIDFFQARQRHRQEVELRELDIKLARVEANAAEKIAGIEAESARGAADAEALRASYREAAQRWSRPGDAWPVQLVDFVRGMTRPALTWGLVGLVAAIYFGLAATSETGIVALRARIVDTVLYLATAAVLWWFGQRQIEKRRAAGAGR